MTEKIENGVYDISIEDYHNGPGISRSTLFEFSKSALHYWHKAINPERERVVPSDIVKKTDALGFGNALHTYVLENENYDNNYAIMPKVNRATKIGKAAYAEFLEQAEGKQIICEEAHNEIVKMSESINNNQWAEPLIEGADYEKSIFWTDPDTQLLCKVRPDIWHENFVADLKTTQRADLRSFTSSVYSYGYHIQAAMIHEAIKHALGKEVRDFVFIAIEKEPPYAIGVHRLDECALEHGIREFKDILMKIYICHENKNWPSYAPGLIMLPNWANNI